MSWRLRIKEISQDFLQDLELKFPDSVLIMPT